MSVEKLKATTYQIVEEVWNQGKVSVLDEIYAPNYVRHKPPFPDINGLEAAKQFIRDSRTSYPDVYVTLDEVIVAENRAVTRWTFQGTQKGQSPTTGVSPTGKQVTFTGCNVAHWANGQIVEEWEYSDWLVFLQQLGVVPELG
jgi:predicted ester cyclase